MPEFDRADLSRIRLCALDIDGTLLNSQHQLSPATSAAIARIARAGCRVVLASSRAPVAIPVVIRQLQGPRKLDVIAAQGALVSTYRADHASAHVFQNSMPTQQAADAVRLIHDSIPTASINWFSSHSWYANAWTDAIERESDIVDAVPTVCALEDISEPALKILVITAGAPESTLLVQRLAALGLNATTSHADYVEITAGGIDKATALRDLCRYRGIRLQDVLAIGDGENDVPMLRAAGLSAAPMNSVASALEAALLRVDSNDANGPAQLLTCLAEHLEKPTRTETS